MELDGTKRCPVHHCDLLEGQSFLLAVADVVRSRFMAVEPGSIEFSLMALCAPEGRRGTHCDCD